MAKPFAAGTKVPEIVTHQQIRSLLRRYGCSETGSYDTPDAEVLLFARDRVTYRFTLPIPDEETAKQSIYDRTGPKERRHYPGPEAQQRERARRLRALLAVVKAKLIAVDEGISTLEQEFLAEIVTDNGQTYGERVVPEIRQAAMDGRIPTALALTGRGQ